jgi:signal transduction histidine kinase
MNSDTPDTATVAGAYGTDPAIGRIAPWRPFRGPFQRWPRVMDTLLAVLSFLLTLMMWSRDGDFSGDNQVMLALAVVGNLALVWRRRNPVEVHTVVLACSALVLVAPSVNGLFALAFSLYSLGRYATDDRASLLGLLVALLLGAIEASWLGVFDPGDLVSLGLMVLVWYVGRRLLFRGEYLRLLEERARYLERSRTEEAARAVAEERTRIARELHDVVAHQVSLMTVQAGAAKTVARSDPDAAVDAMAAVENAGRQALTEMRHLLDVLRPGQSRAQYDPQPGCADLPRLAREVSDAGTAVQLDLSGPLDRLPARVDLAVFRTVQEALTNVIKHAGHGARATVRLQSRDDGVEIEIRDDGRGPGVGPGAGHGITGMRERAELLGGWLTTGAAIGGGFEVRAFLPLAQAPR